MTERFDGRGYEFPYEESIGDEFTPKGVDGGKALINAGPRELLDQHLRLERADIKAFWKDGFILYKLWVSGTFCTMLPEHDGVVVRDVPYPHSRDGFYQFLHDHGSQISPDEVSRRMKVFRAYNRYDLTTIRLVERAGVNKAFAAIPHVHDDSVREMLRLSIDTPYHRLRDTLHALYPRTDAGMRRQPRSRSQVVAANHRKAVRVLSDSGDGMLGDPPIFVPRQYRQETEEEVRSQEIFDTAMKRLGCNDRDGFFLRVVNLVAESWLTADDMRAIEIRMDAYRTGARAAAGRLAAE